ncbi:transcription factor MYB6 [Amborella trichopoda]|uniref:Uncharacterized protein n=1 Tax=Amborella trichopoda TaxID=13333 RepID=U5DDZ0_AMBTC|nr:transcription factor MYB6 [Amborella trichopoda]ERN20440.1 hypothetical protein AMTR_s00068p00118480 [Amborella trichopoda]|eukprot:XP_006858973.1 transcription factor MYB6 [Amborella trichopoda]
MRSPQSSVPAAAAAGRTSGRSSRGSGGPTPCCSKVGLKLGPWTPEEDEVLAAYIGSEGEGRWRTLPKHAGLLRCGKSCRLSWMNYLRPCVKRGRIGADEEDLILRLYRLLGNRWSLIAGRIPGRTDNEIKNYWNTHLSKKLISQGIDPRTHKPLLSSPPPDPLQIPNNKDVISPIIESSRIPQNPNPSTSFPLENPLPNPNSEGLEDEDGSGNDVGLQYSCEEEFGLETTPMRAKKGVKIGNPRINLGGEDEYY